MPARRRPGGQSPPAHPAGLRPHSPDRGTCRAHGPAQLCGGARGLGGVPDEYPTVVTASDNPVVGQCRRSAHRAVVPAQLHWRFGGRIPHMYCPVATSGHDPLARKRDYHLRRAAEREQFDSGGVCSSTSPLQHAPVTATGQDRPVSWQRCHRSNVTGEKTETVVVGSDAVLAGRIPCQHAAVRAHGEGRAIWLRCDCQQQTVRVDRVGEQPTGIPIRSHSTASPSVPTLIAIPSPTAMSCPCGSTAVAHNLSSCRASCAERAGSSGSQLSTRPSDPAVTSCPSGNEDTAHSSPGTRRICTGCPLGWDDTTPPTAHMIVPLPASRSGSQESIRPSAPTVIIRPSCSTATPHKP